MASIDAPSTIGDHRIHAPQADGGRVVVIGGGFYGCCIALHLRSMGCRVILLERSDQLLTRASYNNQARVHNGYHYPRSVLTGLSCVANLPRFVADFREAVSTSFEKLYAIARTNSKVTANQFQAFCHRIGAPARLARPQSKRLFDADLVEEVFEVREPAFDALRMRRLLADRLVKQNIDVRLKLDVLRVESGRHGAGVSLTLADGQHIEADAVYCCTYAQSNVLLRTSRLPLLPLKHEIAELALVEVPPALTNYGITVMDGPFFSCMPFPAEALHSLSHVRYTPRGSWLDNQAEHNPYDLVRTESLDTNYPNMLRDATRYLPVLAKSRYVRSFYEPKTVLVQNEDNDGRPILFRRDHGIPGLHVILGGKIDNIYDVMQMIDTPVAGAGR